MVLTTCLSRRSHLSTVPVKPEKRNASWDRKTGSWQLSRKCQRYWSQTTSIDRYKALGENRALVLEYYDQKVLNKTTKNPAERYKLRDLLRKGERCEPGVKELVACHLGIFVSHSSRHCMLFSRISQSRHTRLDNVYTTMKASGGVISWCSHGWLAAVSPLQLSILRRSLFNGMTYILRFSMTFPHQVTIKAYTSIFHKWKYKMVTFFLEVTTKFKTSSKKNWHIYYIKNYTKGR